MKKIKILFLIVFAFNVCNAQNWENISPGGGGWFMRIGAGPTGVIIACSDLSGCYRSLDRGNTWDCIGSYRGLPTHCLGVGFDPVNPAVIFVGSDAGLFRSSDTANTFIKVSSGGVWTDIDVSLSNPNICYAARHSTWNGNGGIIFKSTDNGKTWAQVSTGLPSTMRIGKIMVHPSNPDIVFFVSGKSRFSNGTEALYKSTDGGISWSQLAGILGGIVDAVFDPSNPQILYVSVNGKGVYKSMDDGASWSSSPLTATVGRLFIKRDNTQVLRLINESGVKETLDGGTTWVQKSLHSDWDQGFTPTWNYEENNGTLLTYDEDLSDPDAYYWVTQMWVYGTFNGGGKFGPLHTMETPAKSNWWKGSGINNTEVFDLTISPADHNILYISLWDDGLWRSLDRGETWQSCNKSNFTGQWSGKGGDSWTVVADPTRPEVVWAGIGQRDQVGYLVKSTMSGEVSSWVNSGTGLPGPANVEIWGLSVDPSSPETQRKLYVTADGAVYKSSDDGANWTISLAGTSSSTSTASYRATAVDYTNGQIVWAGGDAGLQLSQNGGTSWAKSGITEMTGIFDIKTDRNHTGWVYVACYGTAKGIYRSKDKGNTWKKLWTGNYMRGVAVDPVSSDIIYATSSQNFCCGASVSGSTGVIRSTDGGLTWKEENAGLSWPFAFPIEIDPTDNSFVFIGTPGTGFYKRIFNDVPTSIFEKKNETKVLIYPNPFIEKTTIDLSAIRKSTNDNIGFHLYNMVGKEIAVYNHIPGTQFVLTNKDFVHGAYFYRLTRNENFVASGKLIVQ
jgi:photosystem II stability/assembly factor-like uncharacterized protein